MASYQSCGKKERSSMNTVNKDGDNILPCCSLIELVKYDGQSAPQK